MGVYLLFNVPKSQPDWDAWSFAHRTSHSKIRNGIQVEKNINLNNYQVDPIDFGDIAGFLDRNQQAHLEMNQALNLSSSDLEDVDFQNEAQFRAWIAEHAQEHRDAENALGV